MKSMSVILWVVLFLTMCSLVARGHIYLMDLGGRRHALRRLKRSPVDKTGFTLQEKQQVLDLHNRFRAEETASDMTVMEWDNGLEKMAQAWADQCIWTHSRNRFNSDYRYIGENLYANTGIPTALDIVKNWNDERSYYNYYTQQCSKVCGHYTQIVWAQSYAVGCGVRYCRSIQNLNWDRGGYIVVCNYGPGGNIIGERPYTRAQPACSACPGTHPYCIKGLCSKLLPTTSIPVSIRSKGTTVKCPVPVEVCTCKTKEIIAISTAKTVHHYNASYLIVAMVIYFWMK